MAQPGPSDYRGPTSTVDRKDQSEGIMDQVNEAARDVGGRAAGIAEELAVAIKERPYTTLAIAAGLAFAAGAVWKLGRHQPSRMESFLAQLPELPSRRSLERFWR
jgi:hypothetical protein